MLVTLMTGRQKVNLNELPLLICSRYDVDNTDLLRLRLLAQQKQLTDYNAAKDAKLVIE